MQWSGHLIFFWGFVVVILAAAYRYLQRSCNLPKRESADILVYAGAFGVVVFGGCRDLGNFSFQQALIVSAIAAWLWVITAVLGSTVWRIKRFDVPLQEVIALNVTLKREFFSDALNLPDDEIDNCPELISGFNLRLKVWKSHYSGDIAFFRRDGVPERSTIWQFPTTPWQFPVYLGSAGLFRGDDRDEILGPEQLEVRVGPSSFSVKGRSGKFLKQDSVELVIPTRASDLSKFVDTFGRGDPDWLQATGHTRQYERDGRWARWSMVATNPEPLALNIQFLSLGDGPVKLND
jgi:hypothetical protein